MNIVNMRSKIICIQFRISPDLVAQEQFSIQREVRKYSDIDFINILDSNIDWKNPKSIIDGYKGIIFGGSGEFDFDGNREDSDPARVSSYEFLEKLSPLFSYLFDKDFPTLGICYGHQILGAFAGAKVQCDESQKKICSHEIKLAVDKNNNFLLADLPESFYAHYGHKDSLDRVPEGAVLLMNGGCVCRVPALQYKNNIFTTQFHPELNFEDMIKCMKNSPGYLPEGVLPEEIFKDDPSSNTILQNFGKFVAIQH